MGLILPQYVEVKISSRNAKYYEMLGYDIPKKEGGKKDSKKQKNITYDYGAIILVDVLDLPPSSKIYVSVICDCCNETVQVQYANYNAAIKKHGNYYCTNCGHSVRAINTNMDRYGVRSTTQIPEIREKQIATTLERFGVPYYTQTEEAKERIKNTCLQKYGETSFLKTEEYKKKFYATMMGKYGTTHPMYSEEIVEKLKATNMLRYGVPYILQSKEIQAKVTQSLYNNNSQKTSQQQRYINEIYNGELNYPCSHLSLDIALLQEMIDCEIDFGGHNIDVKLGNVSQEEFNQKELIRDKIVKSQGYKIMRIISRKDKLPSDEILLQILEISKEYFNTTSHTWINWDIDAGKYFNAEHQDGLLFNFEKLYKLKSHRKEGKG